MSFSRKLTALYTLNPRPAASLLLIPPQNSHVQTFHANLRKIRQPYLVTSPPPRQSRVLAEGQNHHGKSQGRTFYTDEQRDQIDIESKATLRDLNAGIQQLEDVEKIRKETQVRLAEKRRGRNGFQLLNRWAAGGGADDKPRSPEDELEAARENGLRAHRESVIWYLRRKLGAAAEAQREMMETRIEREVERSKSVLYKTKDSAWTPQDNRSNGSMLSPTDFGKAGGLRSPEAATALSEAAGKKNADLGLSAEQLQLFQEENNDMLQHYEDTLDQVRYVQVLFFVIGYLTAVRTAERSMVEISELQTTLAQNLELQSTRIDQLVEDSANTEQNVAGGNKQLKKASERFRPAQHLFYATCGLSAFLVLWDLII